MSAPDSVHLTTNIGWLVFGFAVAFGTLTACSVLVNYQPPMIFCVTFVFQLIPQFNCVEKNNCASFSFLSFNLIAIPCCIFSL